MAARRGAQVYKGNCPYCKKRVSSKAAACYQITCWVSGLGGKGSRLAEPTGVWAHDYCINEQIYDPNAGQTSLL